MSNGTVNVSTSRSEVELTSEDSRVADRARAPGSKARGWRAGAAGAQTIVCYGVSLQPSSESGWSAKSTPELVPGVHAPRLTIDGERESFGSGSHSTSRDDH